MLGRRASSGSGIERQNRPDMCKSLQALIYSMDTERRHFDVMGPRTRRHVVGWKVVKFEFL